MIPDYVSRLIAAFVDKELDADERQQVIRLARRSKRVRTLLLQLHNDARAVRSLPRMALGQDLSERVLREIANRKVRVARQAALKVRDPMPAWLGMATAAAVLLALGAGLYLYVISIRADRPSAEQKKLNSQLARSDTSERDPVAEKSPAPEAPRKDADQASTPSTKQIEPKHAASPPPAAVASHQNAQPKDGTGDVAPLVKGPMSPVTPVRVDGINPPLIIPLRELERRRGQLRDELSKGDGCQIELACQETAAGIARLRQEFEAQGFSFLVDQDAIARIKIPFPNTSYAVYLESVTPKEILLVLERAALEADSMPKSRGRHPAEFEKVVVKTLTADNRARFTKLLGLDPSTLEHRPFDEVVGNLAGEGGARSEVRPVKTKYQGRMAVVLAAHESGLRPPSVPPLSLEIRQFFETRRERPTGSIRTLIYVKGR
jgi:hypothetical protein